MDTKDGKHVDVGNSINGGEVSVEGHNRIDICSHRQQRDKVNKL